MNRFATNFVRPAGVAAAAFSFCASMAFAVGPGVPTTGPDVTINLLDTLANYTTGIDGYVGYSIGTTSCNIGTQPVNWCDGSSCGGGLTDEQHPVIAQGLYRLKAGRLEQIGMSWLKHGFVSTNSNEGACKFGSSCQGPPLGGNQLGVGCTDTYWGSLNGSRPLGRRSEVNATTGEFPFPATGGGSTAQPADQRLRVDQDDVDPALNSGALYWIDAQYVADNDALAGNGLNNASYRRVSPSASPFNLSLQDTIVRERTAIHAWAAADATVSIHNVDLPGAVVERFEVARKVTQLDADTWHYEYAIRNMNADRSANAFVVDFADGTPIANVGFRDVEHHSGEPFATGDWDSAVTQATGTVQWGTASHASDSNANALRWASMFNFWFDADAAPDTALHGLGLFKPGTPASVSWQWPLFADGFEAHNFAAWSDLGQ